MNAMKKEELANAVVFVKKTHRKDSPVGEIVLNDYDVLHLWCDTDDNVNEGDRIRIVKGRKHPIGTEGTVVRVCMNQYEGSFNCPLSGRKIFINPSLNVELDNGSKIWVTGENCYNLTSESRSIDGKIHKSGEYPSDFGFVSDKGFWYLGEKKKVVLVTSLMSDYGMSIYENYFTETADEYVMILDDWRSDTYPFLVIKKEIKSGNEVIYHRNGRDKRHTDMWDAEGTGLGESIKEYNSYLEKKEVA